MCRRTFCDPTKMFANVRAHTYTDVRTNQEVRTNQIESFPRARPWHHRVS